MAHRILPIARPFVICDQFVAREFGKIDFLGAFTRIAPVTYPHCHRRMSVIAHLSGGLGVVNTSIEIRYAASEELVSTTAPREVAFPSRDVLIRLAHSIEGVIFERPGVYLVEFHCEHMCIADTRLLLREPIHEPSGGGTG